MTSVLPGIARREADTRIADDDRVDEAHDAEAFSAEDLEFDFALDGVLPADDTTESGTKETLTAQQRDILVFERQWWRRAGSKEQAIRERFKLSATRYYQLLNRLLDMPEALALDPLVVGRLRRLRATRARTRTAG